MEYLNILFFVFTSETKFYLTEIIKYNFKYKSKPRLLILNFPQLNIVAVEKLNGAY